MQNALKKVGEDRNGTGRTTSSPKETQKTLARQYGLLLVGWAEQTMEREAWRTMGETFAQWDRKVKKGPS